MQTDIRYFPHLYRDSVALMRLSADLAARPGVDQASLLMGTPANMDLLVDSGLVDAPPPAAPGDIVFVARGEPDALAAAYEAAGQALTQANPAPGRKGRGADVPASLLDAVRAAAESSWGRFRQRLGGRGRGSAGPHIHPRRVCRGPKLSRPCAPGCTP